MKGQIQIVKMQEDILCQTSWKKKMVLEKALDSTIKSIYNHVTLQNSHQNKLRFSLFFTTIFFIDLAIRYWCKKCENFRLKRNQLKNKENCQNLHRNIY